MTSPFDPAQFEADFNELRTLADVIRYAASAFARADLAFAHGTDNAVDEAHVIVLHALHLDAHGPYGSGLAPELYSARLASSEKATVSGLVRRRIEERCPAAYLTGSAWFAGLKFEVDSRVLIPRSPFAELIESSFEPWISPERVERILDVGTGSGCIAIACAYAFPWAEVVAADIDEGARAVAELNVAHHGLEEQVSVVACDALTGINGKFDIIVSNPPYVPPASIEALPPEFRHEPRLGLDGGPDGLDIVRRLLEGARAHLRPHGGIFVEVGESRPEAESAFPELDLIWLDDALENGGEGLFFLSAKALRGN